MPPTCPDCDVDLEPLTVRTRRGNTITAQPEGSSVSGRLKRMVGSAPTLEGYGCTECGLVRLYATELVD